MTDRIRRATLSPAPSAIGSASNRRQAGLVVTLAVVALLISAGCSASRNQHNAAVSDVVERVSELNDRLSFATVEAAFADFTTGADEMGLELDDLLAIDVGQGSSTTPVEVGLPAASTIMTKYDVVASGRNSCVVSVIKPSGYWVEAASGSCASGAIDADVLRYIDEG